VKKSFFRLFFSELNLQKFAGFGEVTFSHKSFGSAGWCCSISTIFKGNFFAKIRSILWGGVAKKWRLRWGVFPALAGGVGLLSFSWF